MQVTINGETRQVPEQITVDELVSLLRMQSKRLAIEVNREILPRSEYGDHRLADGDRVEIVRAIGGG